MNTKRFLRISLFLCLLALSGCTLTSEEPSYISSVSSEISSSSVSSKESSELSSATASSKGSSEISSSEIPAASSEAQEISFSAPEPLEFEEIDFTAMSEEELKEVLGKVLDRAKAFCDYGYAADGKTLGKPDERPEVKFVYDDLNYYPLKGCPYQSIEEIKQDFLTVFPPEAFERQLYYIFSPLMEHDGQIYIASERTTYSKARHWNLDEMKVDTISPHECTVSMPVSCGWADAPIIAPVSFSFIDKHIIVGMDYFTP